MGSFAKISPLLAELSRQKTGLQCFENILRYVYYDSSKDEWNRLVNLFRRIDPIIEEIALTSITRHLIRQGETAGVHRSLKEGMEQGLRQGLEEGKHSKAHDLLLELLEGQFGVRPLGLTEKLRQIQGHGMLRMPRR